MEAFKFICPLCQKKGTNKKGIKGQAGVPKRTNNISSTILKTEILGTSLSKQQPMYHVSFFTNAQ
jgi:hypothetical protein